jgi:hypothetical protein
VTAFAVALGGGAVAGAQIAGSDAPETKLRVTKDGWPFRS